MESKDLINLILYLASQSNSSSGGGGDSSVYITSCDINDSGHLIVTLSDSTVIDAGICKGDKGDPGKDGTDVDLTPYAKKTDLTAYLPKSGGQMSGNIDMMTNKTEILVDTDRVVSENGNNTLPACGELSIGSNTIQEYLPRTRSFLGSYKDANSKTSSIISIRHGNGDSTGRHFGMYLRHEAKRSNNLVWNNQLGTNTWEGERVLLDNVNFADYILPKSEILADTGWQEITCNQVNVTNTSLKVRKIGKLVEMIGTLNLTNAGGESLVLASIPSEFMPENQIEFPVIPKGINYVDVLRPYASIRTNKSIAIFKKGYTGDTEISKIPFTMHVMYFVK